MSGLPLGLPHRLIEAILAISDMALRIVAQATSSASLVDIYTADQDIMLRSLSVCNRAGTAASFRLSVANSGEADANKQYLFYDLPIVPNDSFTSSLEIGLIAGDVVRFYGSNTNMSITLFGESQ